MSEYERAAETDFFRTGDKTHTNSKHVQVANVYIQGCIMSFANILNCIQLWLILVKVMKRAAMWKLPWMYKRIADRRHVKQFFIGSALKPHSETLRPHGF